MTRDKREGRHVTRQRSHQASADRAEGIRRRLAAEPELDLDAEELRALADNGIDPEEVRRIALQERETEEVSEHDRPTAREDVEALMLEENGEPGQ
jgi:hypothetical protein